MKRDMDLIREILLAIEASEVTQGAIRLKLPGRTEDQVSYQIKMLSQAGLIIATDMSSNDGFHWVPRSLTWEGHEFLDAARDNTVWNKAMSKLKETAASAPFEIVKAVVIKTCKDYFGVP